MKVFLTGATGFIGSHLARLLVQEEQEVFCLVGPGKLLKKAEDLIEGVTLIQGSLPDPNLPKGIDICIHLAWDVTPGKYLNSLNNIDFIQRTRLLGTKLEQLGCRRFVGIGTSLEYLPSNIPLKETDPVGPKDLYSSSKLTTYYTLRSLPGQMEIVWPRLFNQYGPFEDARRLVPSVINSLFQERPIELTQGHQLRDYLHVEDTASAIWAIAKSDLTGPVNVGSGRLTTIRSLVSLAGSIIGNPELLDFGGLPSPTDEHWTISADTTLLTTNTGWDRKYNLATGLQQTIEWWRNLAD